VRDNLAVRPSESGNIPDAANGEQLSQDVAIIMPGACLFDDQIITGARTVVEP